MSRYASTNTSREASFGDEDLLKLWLHGKSENTRDAYMRDVMAFSEFVDVPFADVTLAQIQAFDSSLVRFKPATRARKLSAVKSLLSFGHQIGHLERNPAAPVKAPPLKDGLSERILSEESVANIISGIADRRNRLILLVLYYGGLRVSEACSLEWNSVLFRRGAIQLSIHGKGGQTRQVLLPARMGNDLRLLRESRPAHSPVFVSKKTDGRLHRSQIYRIVRDAALRAGLDVAVSPHWLRHAHASHALDNGAPTHLVQRTLGHKSMATTGRYAHARPKDSSGRFIRPVD